MVPLDLQCDLPADQVAALRSSQELVTLEQVIHWGLGPPTIAEIVAVIVQDEFCHDVVMSWQGEHHLVFDTT